MRKTSTGSKHTTNNVVSVGEQESFLCEQMIYSDKLPRKQLKDMKYDISIMSDHSLRVNGYPVKFTQPYRDLTKA